MQLRLVRHATLQLRYPGKTLLIDPLLSEKGTLPAIENVPNAHPNPLVGLPLPLHEVTACDAVLITHTHRDHFDDAAAKALAKNLPLFCQPEDQAALTGRGFSQVTPVSRDGFLAWEGIRLLRTPAQHGHGDWAERMAPASGYLIQACGEPTVYVMGDTVWCDAVREVLRIHQPQVIVCNGGEARFATGLPITMDAADLLSVCQAAPYAAVVAVHMEAWNHCRLSREALRQFVTLHQLDDQVTVPQDGEVILF